MHRARTSALAALLALAFALPASAQESDLQDRFASLATENARGYLLPVAEGLGHALTAGFVEAAHSHKVLGFDVGVRVMAATPPASATTFEAVLPGSIEYNGFTFENPYGTASGSLETPTAVGAGDGVVLIPQGTYREALIQSGENPADYNIPLPEGVDLPAVPFAIAQLSLGLPLDIEATVRMIPAVTPHEDIGQIKATGFGLKHTVSRWVPGFPLDVALFGGVQKFQVGDWLDASARTYGVIASKQMGALTAFGHLRSASADVSVGYTFENPDALPGLPADGSRLGFDADVPAGLRAGGGLTFRLIGLDVTGEYTHGPHPVASLKAGFSIR